MPRPHNTDLRRAQIASALLKLMASRGYDGASIADIAHEAQLTPGLVHYHFKNKQEILLAAFDHLIQDHDTQLEQRLAQANGDPIDQVIAFIDFHLGLGAYADPQALAYWILVSGEALRQPKVRSAYAKALDAFTRRLTITIQQGIAQRLFCCDDPHAAASALLATIQGYLVLAATARDLIPRGSAAPSTKRMAEGLLQPKRPFLPPAQR